MADSRRSEDVYGEKIDRCIYNGLVKLGKSSGFYVGGVSVGIVFSVLLIKRKPWPVILGGGIGTGMALSDCNNEFRSGFPHPHLSHLQRKLNGERPRNMRNELMTESLERIQPTGELLANISAQTGAPLEKEESCLVCKNSSVSCLCKIKEKEPKSARSVKNVKIKPFLSVSDNFEKRAGEGE
ncbi:unnamed protein product [Candidula unifasciata]|uniref:MICOS complex subunit MIC10 n=1 Tax=Candidula unifasciata TaxID=100452 RepID=A0A8S3ZXP1_9EUPU|nr:unnamed protein product [Candidula unifasciata]